MTDMEKLAVQIAKADRYLAVLWRTGYTAAAQKFDKLATQAIAYNDFRVVEMVYTWAEFECRRGSEIANRIERRAVT